MKLLHGLPVLILVLAVAGCGESGSRSELLYTIPEQPEIATGYTWKPGWEFSEFAVAAANPLATDAGYQIIRAGGSAVDAAIAVQMVLTLVEPQSSGIGGGAFLLTSNGSDIYAYDGRETAPSAADQTLFLDEEGEPLAFADAVSSGLSVGVPGTTAMLEAAHQVHGKLSWGDLFIPAIQLAEEGFAISPRLHAQLKADQSLRKDPVARSLYYDENGDVHPVGSILKNPALADILKRIAGEGASAFYTGAIAKDIVRRVQNHPERPGMMQEDDLMNYPGQDFLREAMCSDWRDWRICGFPPPSSGHITIMQILGIIDELGSPSEAVRDSIPTAGWLHLYMEAAKLAFADRNVYVADPAFVDPPGDSWERLLEPEYLRERAALVGEKSMGKAEHGNPSGEFSLYGVQPYQTESGTSHISIIDREGNAVAMTTTIEQGFGSRIMSDGGTGLEGGFHLNNELTDFSLSPFDEESRLIANRAEPGKRPRSSMSPTLIFDRETGCLVASAGSPGGAGIIHYTAKVITGMLAWELDAQEAIDLPNFANYNGPAILETGRFPVTVLDELKSRGHIVTENQLTSGLQAIRNRDGKLYGGADPRREGVVMGE